MYEYHDDSLFPKDEMDALVNETSEEILENETSEDVLENDNSEDVLEDENIKKEEDMKEDKFDYAKATEELESIARKVEDPEFSLDDIDKYVSRSMFLIENCRKYLRTVREKIDEIQ